MLKGLTWRAVAMLDTFVVALIITWIIFGEPRFEESGWIMLIETPLKLVIYYFHERGWQFIWKDHQVTNREVIMKTISWRIFATSMTFVIALTIFNNHTEIATTTTTSNSTVAIAISITELVTKSILYFFHEKIWLRVKLGQVRKLYRYLKAKFVR